MEDAQIVCLYWDRNETAIRETETKYDRYLTKIAYNILYDMGRGNSIDVRLPPLVLGNKSTNLFRPG